MIRRVLIPKERLAVIIGRRGTVKRAIEKETGTRIEVGGDVQIEGEALGVMTAENIITAIGRGFSPEKAAELLGEEKTLAVIELPRDAKALRRIRARLIGTRGKTRRNIEGYTKTAISIYGKTASIIGTYENAEIARVALEKLIKGLTHKTVYKFLEEEKKHRRSQQVVQ